MNYIIDYINYININKNTYYIYIMDIILGNKSNYLCVQLIDIILEYIILIDIITISKLNRKMYEIYNGKIPIILKEKLEKRIKELSGDAKTLFSYIQNNGDVITGSIILQVLYGEKYEKTDVDICCYRRKLFQEIPDKTEYRETKIWNGRQYILRNLNKKGFDELEDRYWPKILGHCNSTDKLHGPLSIAREEIMRTFGIKIFDVSVTEKVNDDEYEIKKVYNFLMLEDNSPYYDYVENIEHNTQKVISHISHDFDLDICSNAFYINKNGKACLYLKNYNNILTKTTFINNVITQSHLIRHVYCVSENNINFEKHIENIPKQLHKRLLKYINRGFKIINDYDTYITTSLDSSHLLKNYPLHLFYQEADYYLQLYKLLPLVIQHSSDLDILLNISQINPNLTTLSISTYQKIHDIQTKLCNSESFFNTFISTHIITSRGYCFDLTDLNEFPTLQSSLTRYKNSIKFHKKKKFNSKTILINKQ